MHFAAVERAQEGSMDVPHRKYFSALFSSDIPHEEHVIVEKRSTPRSGELKSSRNTLTLSLYVALVARFSALSNVLLV